MNKAKFIKLIFAARDRVVKMTFDGGLAEVRCPVCEFIGLEAGKIEINRTEGEVRYCLCHVCDARFRAIGEARPNKNSKRLQEMDKSSVVPDTKIRRPKNGRTKKRT